MKCILPAITVGCGFLLACGLAFGAESNSSFRLYFPKLPLAKANGERIAALDITVTCGHFAGISAIPPDWSFEINSPVSEQANLRGWAGHGASWLWSMAKLDGSIKIAVHDASCFDVAATVISSTADQERSFSFTRSQSVLKAQK